MVAKQLSSQTLTWKKRLLFSIAVSLIVLFVIELGTRVILSISAGPRIFLYGTSYYRNQINSAPEDNHTVMQHENESSGYTKYFPNESKVDHDAEGKTFPVTINGRGFRGREINEEKLPGVIRIITLGASSTFGYYDRDNETYPYYLEEFLNQQVDADVTFEVINLGIPHLHSEEILALFRAEALPLKPDLITFYEGINDSARMQKNTTQQEASPTHSLRENMRSIDWLASIYRGTRDRIVILALVDSVLVNTGTVTYSEEDFQNHIDGKSEHFLKNISAILSLCNEERIVFLVANQQATSQTIQNFAKFTYAEEVEKVQEKLRKEGHVERTELAFLTHQILMNDLESWALSNDVPFVDVIETLDRDRDVLVSWVHLNPKGNRIIAERLAAEITRRLALR